MVQTTPMPKHPPRGSHRRVNWVWFLPFFAFSVLFLLLPTGFLFVGSLTGGHSTITLKYLGQLNQPQFLDAYRTSVELSLATAGIGGLVGILLAWAVIGGIARPSWIRPFMMTFSGVASNFAGVPLAFAFTASLGPVGLVTLILKQHTGFNLYHDGFTLFSFWGLVITYLYFQIPLMILLISPALDTINQWSEAASILGASSSQYWWRVALPILRVPLAGALLVMFGNSFGAYATAYAMTAGMINLIPILIGQEMTGNVLFSPGLGDALAVGMVAIMAVVFGLYLLMNRYQRRWSL